MSRGIEVFKRGLGVALATASVACAVSEAASPTQAVEPTVAEASPTPILGHLMVNQ